MAALTLNIAKVFMPLKSTIIALERDGQMQVFLTSHFVTEYYPLSNAFRRAVATALGVSPDRVSCFSSHNHCVATLGRHLNNVSWEPDENAVAIEDDLTPEGLEVLRGFTAAAREIKDRLVPVEIRYGKGHDSTGPELAGMDSTFSSRRSPA